MPYLQYISQFSPVVNSFSGNSLIATSFYSFHFTSSLKFYSQNILYTYCYLYNEPHSVNLHNLHAK